MVITSHRLLRSPIDCEKYFPPTDKFNQKTSHRLIIISRWEFFWLNLSVDGRYFSQLVGCLSSRWDVITPGVLVHNSAPKPYVALLCILLTFHAIISLFLKRQFFVWKLFIYLHNNPGLYFQTLSKWRLLSILLIIMY